MKYLIVIILLLICIAFEKNYIEHFFTRKNKKVLQSCNQTKINHYRIHPRNTNIKNNKNNSNNSWNKNTSNTSNNSWNNDIIKRPSQYKNALNYNKDISKSCIEGFIGRPYIWIYLENETSARFWESFYSRKNLQEVPEISRLCIKSIVDKNKEIANIQILNEQNLKVFIKECPFSWNDNRVSNICKREYFKYYLLYNYGGLWITPDTLSFNNFTNIFNKLEEVDLITFGCNDNEILCNSEVNNNHHILAANKYNKIIKETLNIITKECKHYLTNFNFNDMSNTILNENINKYKESETIFNFNNQFDGSRDYNGKLITPDNLISTNYTLFLNSKKVIFMKLHTNKMKRNLKYNWLLRLNENQLLESNMWISKLFRFTFNKEQKYYTNYSKYYDNDVLSSYNLQPKTINETLKNIENSNLSTIGTYQLISKESTRNS